MIYPTQGRISTVLTSSSALCGIWTVVYAVLLDMSVFMVAMISVSRIVLLIAPTTNFNVKLSWLIPISYSILTLTLKVTYNILKVSTNSFVPPLMACVFIASDGTVSEEGEPTVHLPNELILTITDTIQTGFTVLPISICSALSLWLLRRSKEMTKQIGGCKKAQDEASKTVIIFTVMYVVCNIPIFIYLIYFWVWNLSIDRSRVYVTQSQFMMSYLEMYSSVFMNSYSSVLVSRVFPAINSTLNPLIYYWRMKKFRGFLKRTMRAAVGKASSAAGATQSENLEL